MERDLLDLLAAFMGGDIDAARREALQARLRSDADFRRAFAGEIGTLGRIRAVQSPEPRWLGMEDTMGHPPHAGGDDFERQVLAKVGVKLRRWAIRRRLGHAAAAAVLLGLVVTGLLIGRGSPELPAPAELAVAVRCDGVEWETGDALRPSPGDKVHAGRLRFRAGRVSLAFLNGVTLSIEGPADLDLLSLDRVFCRRGRLRAQAPRGSEGFTVMAPGCAVVDLGTEFGLDVAPEGPARLMVFEGKAEVSLLGADGSTIKSALLERNTAVEIDPGAGRIRESAPAPGAFPRRTEGPLPPLVLPASYAAAVRAARPWGYWRFGPAEGDLFRNEIEGGPALRKVGPVRQVPGELVFGPGEAEQYLVLDGLWKPDRMIGYAVECWVLSEAYNRSTLVSLSPPPETAGREVHCLLLELTARNREFFHAPGALRFLHRWPPGASGGTNVFSREIYRPNRWMHVVAQRRPDRMEIYLDGEPAGTSPLDATEEITACRVFVGRLLEHPRPDLGQIRPFFGRLAELALYDHPLTSDEIRSRSRMAGGR
jgi:hypothetical protein